MTRSSSRTSSRSLNGGRPLDVDPTYLMTRGYAARFLPTMKKPGQPALTPLSSEEIEKDLRHMQAYHNAVIQYQQQFYWQTNQGDPSVLPPPVAPTVAAAAVPPSLPVRIDPDEEKRKTLLLQKIAKAEIIRDQAEQTYVAHLAHYVQTGQDLKQLQERADRNVQWMEEVTHARAKMVALLRARLQMTRDVLTVLTSRGALLEMTAASAAEAGGGMGASAPTRMSLPEDDEMLQVWNQLEEDFREAVIQCRQTALNNPNQKRKKDTALPWNAIQLPATPNGVPLLVSALSEAPEKSLAWNCNSVFGSKPKSMSWIESQLPDETESPEDMQELREEVEFLTKELNEERQASQDLCHKIGSVCTKQNEFGAMMALVRQETEAVLHRHHVLLESDIAMEAMERLYHEKLEERANQAALGQQADTKEPAPAGEDDVAEDVPPVKTAAIDVANDGDDEGSHSNDDEEDEEGQTTNEWAGNKRGADESFPTGRKRRKV